MAGCVSGLRAFPDATVMETYRCLNGAITWFVLVLVQNILLLSPLVTVVSIECA